MNWFLVVAGCWMFLGSGWSIFHQDYKLAVVYVLYGFANIILAGMRG